MPDPIDYAALAKQAGAVSSQPPQAVDYAALAKQAGAVSSEPSLLDRAMNWLPAAGGAVGGVLGAAAGPLGVIGGATLGAGAGEAYRQLINRARGASAPASPANAASTIAAESVKQGAAPAAAGEGLGAAMNTAGPWLMQSAVKPTLAALKSNGGSAQKLVGTLLDEGINVSAAGVQKLRTLLDATNDEISNALSTSSGMVNPFRVASRLTPTAKSFANQVNPEADLAAIGNAGNEFLANNSRPLPVLDAQALKVGTYQQLRKKYGELGSASTEAQKALARGLKEEIAAEVPAVSALNQKEGQLLQALDSVGRRVALSGNRDPIGFAWVAHNPTTFIAALLDRSPAVKSMLARGMYDSAGAAAKVSPQLIRAAVTSLASGAPASSPEPGSDEK